MNQDKVLKPASREVYLDNLRIYLTILVIFHHAAIAYGGAGDWRVIDPSVDEISPIFLVFFNALNQSYFMSVFFLLAGYFTPGSLEKKGAWEFLKDRLIRLGIPLLVYTTIILNLNDYVFDKFLYRKPFSPVLSYSPGHLWFLQALLVFAIVYVVYRLWADRNADKKYFQYSQGRFPPNRSLALSIFLLAILTFGMRTIFPVGVWFLGVQPGHFVHYIFAFFVGILARRGDWFTRLDKKQARQWGTVSLITMPFFFVLVVLGGLLESEDNLFKFVGGVHWQAFSYALWESILFIGITVFLLHYFRERFNNAGSLGRSMAANVYTVYIIHQTLLYSMNILFLSIDIPTIVKFFVVSLITVPLCFILSSLIRKIPYARRVLG